MPNKVSVIVVNWNGERFLGRCLTALMAQTVKPHEIILVDNASSDGSIEVVRRFSCVRLIRLDKNSGFAKGNNLAIATTSVDSEWIALINPDAFAEPRWLESLLIAAKANSGIDVFCSKLINADAVRVLDGVGDAYHVSGAAWRIGHGALKSRYVDESCEIFSPCAAAALYRRGVLLSMGGFDEDYFCYMEDVDLGFRLRLAGHRCMYVPDAVVSHVGSGTTGGKHSDFAIYHGHRNLVWTFVKDMPGMLFYVLLPLHLLMNLSSIMWFACRGKAGVIWRSKLDALRGLPRAWGKRRAIQRSRVASVNEIWRQLDKTPFPSNGRKKTG